MSSPCLVVYAFRHLDPIL